MSKYIKTLNKREKKRIQAINELQESKIFQQGFTNAEKSQTNIEFARSQDTTKASIMGMYDYEIRKDNLSNNKSEYFDISCCNQESLPCHRHGKSSIKKHLSN